MRQFSAVIKEILLAPDAGPTAWITCQPEAIPAPGQYLSAWAPADRTAPLATALFAARIGPEGFLAAPPIPRSWEPGLPLELRGPLGRGFTLPVTTRRLALAALSETNARLIPVIDLALQKDIAITLFSAAPAPALSSSVEIYPLQELPAGLAWADLLMLDASVDDLDRLRGYFRLKSDEFLPCPAQILVAASMPCGGLAECGACFVPGRRKWKQACQDGPVFDLSELAW